MRKHFFIIIASAFIISCENNDSLEKTPTLQSKSEKANSVSIIPKSSYSKAEMALKERFISMTKSDFLIGKEGMSKEKFQEEMALYILSDCKDLLKENGYNDSDFSRKFDDDYKLIILEAMKFYTNSTKQ